MRVEYDQEDDSLIAEMEREFSSLSCHDSKDVEREDDYEAEWKYSVRTLPDDIAKLLNTIDLLSLRVEALNQIEHELFRWTDRKSKSRRLDAACVRMAWRSAVSGPQRSKTLRIVRHIVDDKKHVAQIQKLQAHECALALPSWQGNPQIKDGILYIRDVTRGTPTFGVRSYPEATPIEIPVLITNIWTRMTGRGRPNCWDVTAGSGTVYDVITTIYKGKVVGTDIAIANDITCYGDIRNIGHHPRHEHKPKLLPGDKGPKTVITRPDLVFIHPPSRGWPACYHIYGPDLEMACSQDIGVLMERKEYVAVIGEAILTAISRLAPGGLISVLIPEYIRCFSKITDDVGTTDELLNYVDIKCTLIDRHRVVDEAPVRQASLDYFRGPLEHLILGRRVM
jgi:hypothetical protein